MEQCIGLFGTCGKSTWRNNLMEVFDYAKIQYYNPQVQDWKPEDAEIEAEHLAKDNIILFPITSETYGVGSLSEVGFGVLSAIKLDDRRDFIVMIDNVLDDELMIDKERAKESLRARALVKQHLKAQNLPNVYLVSTLEEMGDVAFTLYRSNEIRNEIKRFSIKESK